MKTDCELILDVLKDLRPHHIQEIFDKCKPNARNWAIKSRISNLRAKGYDIVNLRDKRLNRANLPIPTAIVEQYGYKDKEAIYQLMPKVENKPLFDEKGQSYFMEDIL